MEDKERQKKQEREEERMKRKGGTARVLEDGG